MKDYYYILGVDTGASEQQIKTAYRKLSLKFHPDKNNGDKFFEERFKDILEAYETLSDLSTRKSYDINRENFVRGKGGAGSWQQYEQDLRRKYEEELRKREEEIKRKYQTPEQKAREESEKRRRESEARHKAEQQRLKNEIDNVKKMILEKEGMLSALQKEIPLLRKRISQLMSQLISLGPEDQQLEININDLDDLKGLIKKSSGLWTGEAYRRQLVELLKKVCCDRLHCLGLLKAYKIQFNSDLIEEIKELSSSYDIIADTLSVFIQFEIIEKAYPHNLK